MNRRLRRRVTNSVRRAVDSATFGPERRRIGNAIRTAPRVKFAHRAPTVGATPDRRPSRAPVTRGGTLDERATRFIRNITDPADMQRPRWDRAIIGGDGTYDQHAVTEPDCHRYIGQHPAVVYHGAFGRAIEGACASCGLVLPLDRGVLPDHEPGPPMYDRCWSCGALHQGGPFYNDPQCKTCELATPQQSPSMEGPTP